MTHISSPLHNHYMIYLLTTTKLIIVGIQANKSSGRAWQM